MSGPIIIAEIRTQDDLIEALRAAKDMRGLSNRWCDEIGDLTDGQTDKVLGPTRVKGLSRFLFSMYHSMFAVKLVMVVDEEATARMQAKWEGRDTSNVRVESGRVSKKLLERAKPLVFEAAGRAGATARNQILSPEYRTKIAVDAVESRWKKQGRKQTKRARQKRASYHRRKGIRARLKDRKIEQQQDGATA